VRAVLRLTVGALFAASIASSAMACTIITDPNDRPPEGLSDAQLRAFFERQFYLNDLAVQRSDWKDADQVILVEVSALRVTGDNRVSAVLRPLATIKGRPVTRVLSDSYAPNHGAMCGETPYPAIGERAIAYARQLPWWENLMAWGRPQILTVRSLRSVIDRRIPLELKAAAERLRGGGS